MKALKGQEEDQLQIKLFQLITVVKVLNELHSNNKIYQEAQDMEEVKVFQKIKRILRTNQ